MNEAALTYRSFRVVAARRPNLAQQSHISHVAQYLFYDNRISCWTCNRRLCCTSDYNFQDYTFRRGRGAGWCQASSWMKAALDAGRTLEEFPAQD
jgi:hypothetical protein